MPNNDRSYSDWLTQAELLKERRAVLDDLKMEYYEAARRLSVLPYSEQYIPVSASERDEIIKSVNYWCSLDGPTLWSRLMGASPPTRKQPGSLWVEKSSSFDTLDIFVDLGSQGVMKVPVAADQLIGQRGLDTLQAMVHRLGIQVSNQLSKQSDEVFARSFQVSKEQAYEDARRALSELRPQAQEDLFRTRADAESWRKVVQVWEDFKDYDYEDTSDAIYSVVEEILNGKTAKPCDSCGGSGVEMAPSIDVVGIPGGEMAVGPCPACDPPSTD